MKRALAVFFILPILFSFASAADPLKSLSRKINSRLRAKKSLSVAVLDFTYDRGRTSSGSRIVSERLTTYLIQSGARVVERRLIQQILEEKKLLQTGVVDLSRIKDQKEIIGVDALVTGTLSDLSDDATQVVARAIKLDTAEVLAAGTVIIDREWGDAPRAPRKFEARSPVPFTTSQLDFNQQGPEHFHTLSETEHRRKRVEYYPAPVPFFLPTAANSIRQGGIK